MASKADNWTMIQPPVTITVTHIYSKHSRSLSADARRGNTIEAKWPGIGGKVDFDLMTGYGKDETANWRMSIESARAILGKPEHEFKEPRKDKVATRAPKPIKVDPRQVDLFADGARGAK